ncbi:hypothetical protein BLNAU_14481 [Blattamonas nauphoetae]|uniref:Uncharacterized protein n=1 Tax=Blattamonas nauphoetae TaxID=2049346 RepID=A0ABQ9XIC6_9EUKA|nr:hypothetical protein BLNAU_14481 [Blattamonas nauphoetae]
MRADNELLARSLVRCESVCDLVGAEKCIRDIPLFVDQIINVLGSSDDLLRSATFSPFMFFIDAPIVNHQLPRLWNRLRHAFRDGRLEEQFTLIHISRRWVYSSSDSSLPMFPFDQFDWDGLFSADLSKWIIFVDSIQLIMSLPYRWVNEQIGRTKATQMILSFERHQHAASRINSKFDYFVSQAVTIQTLQILISYSLLMSLLMKSDFTNTLTTFLTTHSDLDVNLLLPIQNNFALLCHTSLNRHKPHQPPLDLLFEWTLRQFPLGFFVFSTEIFPEHMPSLLNTALIGFHALCQRGVHIRLLEDAYFQDGSQQINSFGLFYTPLCEYSLNLFLLFPPPLVIRFFIPILWVRSNIGFCVDALKVVMSALLIPTSSFGDCISLKELYRSVRLRRNKHQQRNSPTTVHPPLSPHIPSPFLSPHTDSV